MEGATGTGTASFALTAVGALLAGAGTTLTWSSTGLRRDLRGALDLEYRGLDLAEGIAALVVSVAALALLAYVRRRGDRPHLSSIGLVVAGLLLVALPAWAAVRADARAVGEIADVVARSAGITMEEATQRVRTDPDLSVRTDSTSVWPSIAGGVLVTLGGMTGLLWAGRDPADGRGDVP